MISESQYYKELDRTHEFELALEAAANGDQAVDFAAEIDPQDQAEFIALMISDKPIYEKLCAIEDMQTSFKKWFKKEWSK